MIIWISDELWKTVNLTFINHLVIMGKFFVGRLYINPKGIGLGILDSLIARCPPPPSPMAFRFKVHVQADNGPGKANVIDGHPSSMVCLSWSPCDATVSVDAVFMWLWQSYLKTMLYVYAKYHTTPWLAVWMWIHGSGQFLCCNEHETNFHGP